MGRKQLLKSLQEGNFRDELGKPWFKRYNKRLIKALVQYLYCKLKKNFPENIITQMLTFHILKANRLATRIKYAPCSVVVI